MLPTPLRVLWGDLTNAELKKFGYLSAIVALIIGNYWMLRAMKDAIFNDLVGLEWMPRAKLSTILVMVFVIFLFNKLVDVFEKHKLFYIFCGIYGVLFFFIAFASANPNLFSISLTSPLFPYVAWLPGKFVGWLSYVVFESSVILIILFWAFVNSMTLPESAKKGYAMVVFFAQFGMVVGGLFESTYVTKLGLPSLFIIGAILLFIVPFIIQLYTSFIPHEKPEKQEDKKKSTFFEGLKIIFTRPYVAGIFIVATAYEIIGTILEYQMNMIARNAYPTNIDGGAGFAAFTGKYFMLMGIVSLLFALLGTSYFMRKFGLLFCLVIYPVTIGLIISSLFITNLFGISTIQLMWLIFSSMIIIKGLNYALNNPTKEIMYIPTSTNIKFKAKSWIDGFGNRSTKALGALATNNLGYSLTKLFNKVKL